MLGNLLNIVLIILYCIYAYCALWTLLYHSHNIVSIVETDNLYLFGAKASASTRLMQVAQKMSGVASFNGLGYIQIKTAYASIHNLASIMIAQC